MTVVIARKFGRRISIAADTMITDSEIGKQDAIPGQLKCITISPRVSVAYAGHAEPAISAIRIARKILLETSDIREATKPLLQFGARSDIDVDFILAFHLRGQPFLHKITSAGMSDDLEECVIGNTAIVQDLLRLEFSRMAEAQTELDIQAGEIKFLAAFEELFHKRGVQIIEGVGGLPITAIASPFGHYYCNKALSMSWDTIDLSVGITPDQHIRQRAGETSWQYNTVAGRLRGVPVLGIAFPQAGLGYIYSPTISYDPESIQVEVCEGSGFIDSTRLLEAVGERVNDLSERDGTGVEELLCDW